MHTRSQEHQKYSVLPSGLKEQEQVSFQNYATRNENSLRTIANAFETCAC